MGFELIYKNLDKRDYCSSQILWSNYQKRNNNKTSPLLC